MKTLITTDPEKATFQAKREFAADLSLVWRAWTEAELLDQWWAPKPWKTETKSMDFRPGGRWLYDMVGPEGERHGSLQRFEEIAKEEFFTGEDAFTDSEGNVNEEMPVGFWKNTFVATERGTLVTSFIQYPNREALETIVNMGMAEGLSLAQDNLDELLAALAGSPSGGKITVKAVIAAAPDKVWERYTAPEHITQWNFASDDWHCPRAENDMRVGGKYSARMEAKDGSWGFDFEAVYDEIEDGKSFTYTMEDGRKVTADFNDLGGQTEVVVTFYAESENPVEMQQAGWQAILDNFKKYAERS